MVRDLHAIRRQSAAQCPTGIGKAAIEVISPPSIEHAALPPEGARSLRRATKSQLSLRSARSLRHSTLVAIGANRALKFAGMS